MVGAATNSTDSLVMRFSLIVLTRRFITIQLGIKRQLDGAMEL